MSSFYARIEKKKKKKKERERLEKKERERLDKIKETLEGKEERGLIDLMYNSKHYGSQDEELTADTKEKKKEEIQREKQERERREAEKRGDDIIYQHVETLRRKRIQKIIKDDYGNVFDEKWEQEKEYFFQNVMKKDKTRSFLYEKTKYLIDEILDKYDENASLEYSENMSPYDYEHYCASLLNENGWEAQATQGSGDQGVDVVATKNGHRIAIQCKKYSSPVGNKAVQEVFSAKSHVGADHAIVVTNHSYTKSAKELASTTGVLLLHHDELKNLPF